VLLLLEIHVELLDQLLFQVKFVLSFYDKCETSSFWDNLCLSTIYHVLFWDTACLTTIYQALQILQEKRQRIRTRAKTNPTFGAGMTNNAD